MDITPRESAVHFSLGRLYKLLGERAKALHHLTLAMDLDTKGRKKEHHSSLTTPTHVCIRATDNPQIRKALDMLASEEDVEESPDDLLRI